MGRKRRNTDPQYLKLVTIRTEGAQLFMVPGKELNDILGGIIARYQEQFSIEIFAYCALSNHYHLLVRAPKENLWQFQQAINREIAKRVNRLRNREGHFWSRRYSDEIVVGNQASLTALQYITCNSVKHRLIKDPGKWPGLTSHFHLLDEKDRMFYFTDYTAYRKAKARARITGGKVNLADFRIPVTLRISPLPMFAGLSKKVRRQTIRSEIQRYVTLLNAEAEREEKGYLREEKILTQNPFSKPRDVSKSNRPICYTQDPEAKHIFLTEIYYPWNEAYEAASFEFRSGKFNAQFPPHCIKPPLLYLID